MQSKSVYFSHDCNARNDIKIIRLRRQLGMEGYGIYWCLVEALRETSDFRLPLEAIEDIAFQIDVAKEKVDTVIKAYGLFKIENEYFFSQRLIRSMELYDKLSEAGKKGAMLRWHGENKNNGSPPLKHL